MFADLLERLRRCAPHAFPRATAEMIAAAEEELGFRLPRLLRAVYRVVGNGGFGPGHGLIGVGGAEPYNSTEDSVVDLYEREIRANRPNEPRKYRWPEKLLPICDYGCGSFACVDCARGSARVLWFDADAYGLAGECRPRKCLRLESRSLAEWLEEWLRKQPAEPGPLRNQPGG
jgi:SMI1 / KNR4 family (SUKH-1)